jgi:hypothetical protein
MATNVADLPFNKAELPARDIPRETIDHVADPQVTQQYVPPKVQEYIAAQPTAPSQSKLDRLLEEFRIPILVGIVYMLFEMPLAQSMLVKFAPTLFADSSTSLFVKSVSMAAAFYAVTLGLEYMSKP